MKANSVALQPGTYCCGQFTEDDQWYRARVTQLWKEGQSPKTVQVIYVDFGNYENLPLDRLRLLRKEDAELPMGAVLCRLEGVEPLDGVCEWLNCALVYCAVQWCALLYCTGQCCTVLCCAALQCNALYCTVLCRTVLYYVVLCCPTLCCALLCCTVLYCTVLSCVLCHTVDIRRVMPTLPSTTGTRYRLVYRREITCYKDVFRHC